MPLLKPQTIQGQTSVPCGPPNSPFQSSDVSGNATNSMSRDESMAPQFRPPLNQSIPQLHSGSKTSPQSVQKMAQNSGQSVAVDESDSTNNKTLNPNLSFSEQDLQSLLSQRQVTASLAEDLIAQLGLESNSTQTTQSTNSSHNHITANTSSAQNSFNCEQTISSFLCSKPSQKSGEYSSASVPHSSTSSQPQLNIKMTAKEVIISCKSLQKNARIVSSLCSDEGKPPVPPDPPYPPLPKDKLHPAAPSVFVSLLLIRFEFCKYILF